MHKKNKCKQFENRPIELRTKEITIIVPKYIDSRRLQVVQQYLQLRHFRCSSTVTKPVGSRPTWNIFECLRHDYSSRKNITQLFGCLTTQKKKILKKSKESFLLGSSSYGYPQRRRATLNIFNTPPSFNLIYYDFSYCGNDEYFFF